ncbi:hypothetical protein EJB05_36789, partial [Eragrostis curvula]
MTFDARRGSSVSGLAELKRYLASARFGYLERRPEHDDAFDVHTATAVLKRFQFRLSLPVTSQLDSATLDRPDHVPALRRRCPYQSQPPASSRLALTYTRTLWKPRTKAMTDSRARIGRSWERMAAWQGREIKRLAEHHYKYSTDCVKRM